LTRQELIGIINISDTVKKIKVTKEKRIYFYETISKLPSLLRINSDSNPDTGNKSLVAGSGMILCFEIVLIVYD